MKITRTLTISAIALAGFAAVGNVARADVTVASTVSINSTGGPNGARQHTEKLTVYYKGDNVRIESGNGPVMVYSGGKLYRIDASEQTYSVMPTPPKRTGTPPPNNDTFALAATSQTSNVAGQTATQYQLTASGPAGPPPRPPQAGNGNGGPGSDNGNVDNGPPPPGDQNGGGPPQASVSGQIWLSDSVKIDSGAKDALMIAVGRSLGLRGPLAMPLVNKLIGMGDAPLSANITITMPAAPDGTTPTITVKSTVTSVSTSALDDSLFAIPSAYTKVEGPRGGPGGGGPGGGGQGGPPPDGGGPGGGGPGGPPPGE